MIVQRDRATSEISSTFNNNVEAELGPENERKGNTLNSVLNRYVEQRKLWYQCKEFKAGPRFSGYQMASESESDFSSETAHKPKIEDFVKSFEEQIAEVNKMYRVSKQQFENDMKTFKEGEIIREEEMIEKFINDGGLTYEQQEAMWMEKANLAEGKQKHEKERNEEMTHSDM